MGKLYKRICKAVREDRFIVSFHADERCEERGISAWQLVSGLDTSVWFESAPKASLILRSLYGLNWSTVLRSRLVVA